MMPVIWQDVRRAARSLTKSPRTTSIAVATLGLGIGATTAIFSVFYGVLLKPLPFAEPDRVVQLWQINEDSPKARFSHPNFVDLHERTRSFQALAQYASNAVSVAGGSEPARVRAARVSREFFDALGVSPLLGRSFVAEELNEGAAPVALVGYGYWQRYLGGTRDLASIRLRLSGDLYSVVGVLPPGFSFPDDSALWTPREQGPRYPSRTAHNWSVVGRLEDGVTLERARAEVSALAKEIGATHSEDNWIVDASVVPLHEEMVGASRPALLVLLGAVAFLLLVACANVVNLLLARAAARRRELVVCSALGASRWDLLKPFLYESLLLSLAGGTLGVLFARWGVGALLVFEPGNLPRVGDVGVNLSMLVFALGVSVATALALSVSATFQTAGWNLETALRESQRSQGGGASSARLRGLLVVSQVALTLVLLVGAGLLARSLFRLLSVDPGFETEGRLVMNLSYPLPFPPDEADKARLSQAQEALLGRLAALPGVERVGAIDRLPMGAGYRDGLFLIMTSTEIPSMEDFPRLAQDPSRVGEAEYRAASRGYFETMGIPLRRGRLFTAAEGVDSPHVAVISESLAATRWPDQDPLGKLIEFGNMDGDLRVMRVVGIVGDVRHGGLHAAPRPTIYVNAHQRPPGTVSFVMEVASAPASITPGARGIVSELAPDIPPRFRSMEDVFSQSIADRRFNLLLLGVFAGAALALAVMGIYGVIAYGVSRRTQEIGVRVALGARQTDVVRLVVGQGFRLVAAGIGAGVLGSLALTRILENLLFEVSPTDPMTFVGLALALGSVAVVACYVPARYAARTDPMVALRYE